MTLRDCELCNVTLVLLLTSASNIALIIASNESRDTPNDGIFSEGLPCFPPLKNISKLKSGGKTEAPAVR